VSGGSGDQALFHQETLKKVAKQLITFGMKMPAVCKNAAQSSRAKLSMLISLPIQRHTRHP